MKNNVKNYGGFILFIIVTIAVISYGIFYVFNNLTAESYTFNKDGYALYVSENSNYEAESYSFSNGSTYNYKKVNNRITFDSSEKGNVSIDESTVIHYSDDSLLVLKNVVGLDLSIIDNEIILYYNIYKNTNINADGGVYTVTSSTGEKINFKNLLLRINDGKYLFVSDNIRATIGKDEVVDFGKYIYIEYSDGSVIGIYNNTKHYQSIADELSIVSGDITINMADKSISKEGEKYITLSNLVINSNANIDLIPQETGKLPTINKPNVDTNISGGETGSENNGSVGESDNNVDEEVVEDQNKVTKQPVYKITNMVVTPIKLDAEIEIVDEDSLITSPTEITVVNNATLKVVYEGSAQAGDTSAFISCAGLDPDTEYTIYAKATYTIDDADYTKSFISKIFRTEALGVKFKKSYATVDSLVVEVNKDDYSDVTSAVVSVYDEAGGRITFQGVNLANDKTVELTFANLDKNTKYTVVMHDVMCEGVTVQEGYSEEIDMYTLKEAPTIGNLEYEINKRTSKFILSVSNIKDEDYGISKYKYEVFSVNQNMETDSPLVVLESNNLDPVELNVDENKILRGSAYTYRLIVVFNDNDKTIEYTKELGTSMIMEGVAYPTIRFEETFISHEQIKGTIIIDDPNSTITGDDYRVVYKNSADVYTTDTITASTSELTIPIAVNDLRKDETYTFQVYADIRLHDGNPVINEAYIGSVIVQTKEPNPLVANFSLGNDPSSRFAVNLKLSNPENKNSELEASTISEMTLTLYQGGVTPDGKPTGKVEVYKKVVDLNNADYISTIKEAFYDSQKLLKPEFFDVENEDLGQSSYTLEISKVYDYTKYKNEIPIENNTFAFNANMIIPGLPDDDSIPISITRILNKNATVFGLEHDDNLSPNAVVGYNAIANFVNTSKTAKRIVYHMWAYNHITKTYEIVEDKEVQYDEEGNASSVVFEVGYGTPYSTFDSDKLRRGNEYYISYEVYLDMDANGEEDAIYPKILDENAIIKSDSFYPEKEYPVFQMYPSVSTESSATWKYKITDVDNALDSNNIYSFVGNNSNPSSNPAISVNNDDFSSVTFTGLASDDFYSLKSSVRLTKSKDASYYPLSSQYLSPFKDELDLDYTAKISSNMLEVAISDYENNAELIDSISSVDIIITPTTNNKIEPVTISNVLLDNGVAFINLIELAQFINVEISVGLKVYYDSGNTGYDVTSNYKALQKVTLDGSGNYYSISKNEFVQNPVITGSEFITEFDPVAQLLSVTDKNGTLLKVPVSIDERGVMYNKNIVVLKELTEQTLTSSNNVVTFKLLVPNISMHTNNNLNIVSLLDSVEVTPKITVAKDVTLVDDLIYIELFLTDKDGNNAVPQRVITKTLTSLKENPTFTIDGLSPKSDYYINFYTYVKSSPTATTGEKFYLYDENERKLGVNYTFNTLSDVGIHNINAQFLIDSYEEKSIKISYSIKNIYGFNRIEYKLYEYKDGNFTQVDIPLENAEFIYDDMSFEIEAPPGNEYEFSYGKTYKIVISPLGKYYNANNEEKIIDLGTKEYVFTLSEYVEPYVGISASKTDSSIFFRVSIDDTSKVIVDGVYSVKLVDSNYETIETITNIDAKSINKRFDFNADTYNLEQNSTYMFVVTFEADYNNSGEDFKTVSKSKSILYGNTVNIGAVTATKNPNDDYIINIIFADSYMLTSINTIKYTVSSTTISYFSTGTAKFTTIYNPDTNIYTYQMAVDENENFKSGNVYTITMNFYTDDKLVQQEEISYYYEGGQ